ncbi:MAG: hypothetical protein OXP69_16725 [Spirochaetaceae bacterium]|nr:hypothetical protein [Spirochaetaceae bacterium]
MFTVFLPARRYFRHLPERGGRLNLDCPVGSPYVSEMTGARSEYPISAGRPESQMNPSLTTSVSVATREEVWDQLLDVCHYADYFNDLCDRMTRWYRWRTALQGLIAAGVVGSLLGFLPETAALVGSIAVVAFSVYSLVRDYSQELATVRSITDKCAQLRTRVRALWSDIQNYTVGTAEAHARWVALEQEMDDLMREAPPTRKRLSKRAEQRAVSTARVAPTGTVE